MLVRIAAVASATALVLTAASSPAGAIGVEQIQGSGSSWSAGAVKQWISDVTQQGLQVVFTPSGSAQGRTDFGNDVTDFAVSDIGYQGQNPQTGVNDTSNRPYVYLPIVGGATAFPYNLVVAGQRVQNLRLSGLTLAKIFTDQITNWDDPEITADNNGHAFPSIPIVPVVHSEGAGTGSSSRSSSTRSTRRCGNRSLATPFQSSSGQPGQGNQVAENGSDGVMDFVASAPVKGSIGFDEYFYALGKSSPVGRPRELGRVFHDARRLRRRRIAFSAQINTNPNPAVCFATRVRPSPVLPARRKS